MRAKEYRKFIIEAPVEDSPEISNLKAQIASKIKQLPVDPATLKLLAEIEDILASVGAGSRSEVINNELQAINDPDVNEAQKMLAKMVLSLDASPKDRNAMLKVWKADKLVNIKKLLTSGTHTIADIINGYGSNPAIKELTDELARVAALGQGKGEFLLSVYSKSITKAVKGDLLINGVGTLEVKTQDKKPARFTDQQVRVTSQYIPNVEKFYKKFDGEIKQLGLSAPSGINISGLIKLGQALDTKKRSQFKSALTPVIKHLFPEAPDYVKTIVDSIVSGNEPVAKQKYAQASLKNYLAQKDDIGVLAINLSVNPNTFTFFKDNQDLNAGGYRMNINTAYPVTMDAQRNPYPQVSFVATSRPGEQ